MSYDNKYGSQSNQPGKPQGGQQQPQDKKSPSQGGRTTTGTPGQGSSRDAQGRDMHDSSKNPSQR